MIQKIKELFEEARKLYPGSKQGPEREYANFIKRSTRPTPDGMKFDIDFVAPLFKAAIEYQIRWRQWCKDNNQFAPQWKNFQTWINKGCWEDEHPEFPDKQEVELTEEDKLKNKAEREAIKKDIQNG